MLLVYFIFADIESLWVSWGSSVQCPAIGRAAGVQSPAEANNFSSSLCVQSSSEAHPASYLVGAGGEARPGVTLTTHPI
jgi:hypothetical protein